jgi:hypothetical protein
MAIKRSLISPGRDFLGVFNEATTDEPAELILSNAVAPQLANRDRELPGVAADVRSVIAGLQKMANRSLGRSSKTPVHVRNPAISVDCGMWKITRKHPAILPLAQRVYNIIYLFLLVNTFSPN